jgi:hypothetical protein
MSRLAFVVYGSTQSGGSIGALVRAFAAEQSEAPANIL